MAQQQQVREPVRVVDPTILTDVDGVPCLRGARCGSCATTTFPAQARCPRCSVLGMEEVDLPTRGALWAFTVHYFQPKSPFRSSAGFEPFGVGYVDLGPVIVEGRLTVSDVTQLQIGQPMELALVPAYEEDEEAVFTYAFAPAHPVAVS